MINNNNDSVINVSSKKRKIKYDENGNPIKKSRQTNKTKYPLVKVQPRTAYQFFIMEKAEEVRSGGPDVPKLKTKELSELWQATEDRTKWLDMAKDDRVRFLDEVKSHGYEVKEPNKKPARPCSAFLLFARANQKEYRDEHNVSYGEALKALGVQWKDPNFDSIKAPFIEEAKRHKEEWEKEHGKGNTE